MTPAPKQVKRPRALVPAPQAHGAVPAPFTANDAAAVQAFAAGSANEGQQKHALRWILESACALPLWPYRDNQRETDIALGRHFVGQQIMGVLRVNVSQLRKREELNG